MMICERCGHEHGGSEPVTVMATCIVNLRADLDKARAEIAGTDLRPAALIDRAAEVTDGWYSNDYRCEGRGHARHWCCSSALGDMRSAIVDALVEVRDLERARLREIWRRRDHDDAEWWDEMGAALAVEGDGSR